MGARGQLVGSRAYGQAMAAGRVSLALGAVATLALAACGSAPHQRAAAARPGTAMTVTTATPVPAGEARSTRSPVGSARSVGKSDGVAASSSSGAASTTTSIAVAQQGLAISYQGPTRTSQGRWEQHAVGGRNVLVWLPAEYATRASAPGRGFPVVLLLHGNPGNYQNWAGADADVQADALLAAGQLRPAILVLPQLYATTPNGDPGCQDDTETYLTRVLIPWIDLTYATNASRAIGGLSDGGGCGVVWATRHPDLFRAAFSLAGYFPLAPSGIAPLPVLVQVGSGDNVDERGQSTQAASILGVPVMWTPGVSHSFEVWNRELGFVLPWVLRHLSDDWPLRTRAAMDQVTLGAPAPIPGNVNRVPPPHMLLAYRTPD
jgi:S-formylglutathione hydrolase FrmB